MDGNRSNNMCKNSVSKKGHGKQILLSSQIKGDAASFSIKGLSGQLLFCLC